MVNSVKKISSFEFVAFSGMRFMTKLFRKNNKRQLNIDFRKKSLVKYLEFV